MAMNWRCLRILCRFFACSFLALLSACALASHEIPRFGINGRYQQGKDQFLRGRGGNMDKAIAGLESVVTEDPAYKDSLTLLARAYYKRQRYKDAFSILQRALALNKDDEVAWLVLGLTQLHLGQNESGMQSLKGGITLLARSSTAEYWNAETREEEAISSALMVLLRRHHRRSAAVPVARRVAQDRSLLQISR